jgi:hypothetical protein
MKTDRDYRRQGETDEPKKRLSIVRSHFEVPGIFCRLACLYHCAEVLTRFRRYRPDTLEKLRSPNVFQCGPQLVRQEVNRER